MQMKRNFKEGVVNNFKTYTHTQTYIYKKGSKRSTIIIMPSLLSSTTVRSLEGERGQVRAMSLL